MAIIILVFIFNPYFCHEKKIKEAVKREIIKFNIYVENHFHLEESPL